MPSLSAVAPVAELRVARVAYAGGEALHGVDLVLPAGTITAIVGPNGAGKSTLLDVLAGVRPVTSGRVVRATSSCAYVPQRTSISRRLPVTVRDIVTLGAWGRVGLWKPLDTRSRETVDDAIRKMGLWHLRGAPFRELSGGQQQRALLAQGLARRADLLLLDEPTAALDADSAARILEVLVSEAARGAAVACATHDPELIDIAGSVVCLEEGRIVSRAAETQPGGSVRCGRMGARSASEGLQSTPDASTAT